MGADQLIVPLGIVGAVILSILSGKIDRPGGALGGIMTYLLFLGGGLLGILLIGVFFVLGTLASRWKQHQKTAWGVAEDRDGQRGWRNVVANAGVASLTAAIVWREPSFVDLGKVVISACFAAALSDTWSSEFGNIYGSKYYHVLTGRKDQRGRDGVVSLEGSLAGILGSGVMALLYIADQGMRYEALVILIAGVIGNLTDSVLGATVERKGVVGNHTVNFLNTFVAALLAYFLVKSCSMSS